jgi:release factor glutamine methyltransferase
MSNDRPAPRTIRELLQVSTEWLEAKEVDSPRLDAEVLLAHTLGDTRLQLYMDMERPLTDDERSSYRELLVRRSKHEPVAYIVGEKEFYGLPLTVSADVLVPRPDTETLVELVLERLGDEADGLVVDLCTGSGCVAVALAKERPGLRLIATDVSAPALGVAQQNAERHEVAERVELREGDLLAPVLDVQGALSVVGNPPYIRRGDRDGLMADVRDFEPDAALFGDDDDGLGHHRRVLGSVAPLLAAGGFVALECGFDQGEGLLGLDHPGLSAGELYRDLGGHVRGAVWMREGDD